MRIVNATDTIVPFMRFADPSLEEFTGMDLQEFAVEQPDEARRLLRDRMFQIEHSSEYYDLEFYLQASSLYSSAGLPSRQKRRRRWH
ncbi:hypothetical protein [Microbacterium sp. SORGH_AS_0421]|uniref:hypothetical protein n=1 Tax=Microbacterium sp. SORGH_AS_0421 TaxID=3041768 RepID=UPI0027910D06|nr:hypothetical protein [Microbacterium sp. SORGH_AS_0421]MDQ1175406.1 hypothetical protein [Microbacterium sp. SORGH_AS_0421]